MRQTLTLINTFLVRHLVLDTFVLLFRVEYYDTCILLYLLYKTLFSSINTLYSFTYTSVLVQTTEVSICYTLSYLT
jgi:hypothetical protein